MLRASASGNGGVPGSASESAARRGQPCRPRFPPPPSQWKVIDSIAFLTRLKLIFYESMGSRSGGSATGLNTTAPPPPEKRGVPGLASVERSGVPTLPPCLSQTEWRRDNTNRGVGTEGPAPGMTAISETGPRGCSGREGGGHLGPVGVEEAVAGLGEEEGQGGGPQVPGGGGGKDENPTGEESQGGRQWQRMA